MSERGREWREGNVADAHAHVRLDAGMTWKLFFNALGREEAARLVEASCDEELCAAFPCARSVLL